MNYSIKDFEIMAPVGSRESLAAAINAGADSIYFSPMRRAWREKLPHHKHYNL